MKLAYFVHDLNDPAVHRRLRMLRCAGVYVSLLGFARGALRSSLIDGPPPVRLGQTRDARMVHRVLAVLRAARRISQWRDAVAGADVIMARQLETLVLAVLARRRIAPDARLVFECLDIHRLLTSRGIAGRMLRWLEGRLLRNCDLLVVSSPAFVEAYFAKVHANLPPTHLVENRPLLSELTQCMPDTTVGDWRYQPVRWRRPPWRIGWFGVIRCRRSLAILAMLVRRFPGRVEVVIRGRPARNVMPEFDAVIAATPGLHYLGPYDRERDLAWIYADIHYVWAIDYYEADANSKWLLPNRLYEGGAYGAIPIAQRSVETGYWLTRHEAGICLDEPLAETLIAFIASLDEERDAAAQAAMRGIPLAAFVCDAASCRSFALALAHRQSVPI